MNFLKNKLFYLDRSILLLILTLVGIGVVLIYSSSFIFAIETRGDGLYFFKKQIVYALMGIVAMLTTSLLPIDLIKKYGYVGWLVFGFMVILTFIPGIGAKAGGATRWIRVGGGIYFEPSEFLKISLPLMLSHILYRFSESPNKLKSFLTLSLFFLPLPILLKQPDFGSFAVCSFVIFCTLFVYGLRWIWVISGAILASNAFYFLVFNVPYRKARVMAFLDPWSELARGGYQVIQSLLSFHTGGLLGAGLGEGQGKLFFLPEAHTDFIFSVLGEETGFLGVITVVFLFALLITRTFQIVVKIKDTQEQIIALGLSIVFAVQVLINLGVVLGLLPTKGLALPFLSYGGSSLIATCILFGLLLNIQRNQVKFYRL